MTLLRSHNRLYDRTSSICCFSVFKEVVIMLLLRASRSREKLFETSSRCAVKKGVSNHGLKFRKGKILYSYSFVRQEWEVTMHDL